MAPSPLQQRRTRNTLLFRKLLNLRDGASPFTLVLDTLEQSGGPVVREFARRAKISKSKIILISFVTLKKKVPFEIDIFISARGKALSALQTEILSYLPPPPTSAPPPGSPKYMLIIDTLHSLSSTHNLHIAPFLSSLLVSPQISLLATYHTDIPISTPASTTPSSSTYNPHPLTTLTYLATAILTIQNLSQVVAAKNARDRSLQEPVFGIEERREGVISGLKTHGKDEGGRGVVVGMEIRRRSGRGVVENFVLLPPSSANTKSLPVGDIVLLDDHPLLAPPQITLAASQTRGGDEVEITFNLNLTEKQKRDREGVVLPYYDAQKEGGVAGPGEGGRILYEMGAEDREDFDDEEDEV